MSSKTRRLKTQKHKIRRSKTHKRKRVLHRKISGGVGQSNDFIPYPQNEFTNDPSRMPIGNISSRTMIGGKKRQRFNKSKKIGGTPYAAMPLGTGSPLWQYPFTLFGTAANTGLLTATGIPLTSTPSDNSNYVRAIV